MTSNNFLTFPLINLKLVDQYKWKDPIIMSKYKKNYAMQVIFMEEVT